MRNLAITISAIAAIFVAGSFAWKADAATWMEKARTRAAAENYTPIQNAACGGRWGPYCPPGSYRRCGPNGYCWCAPC
jgi:hypothetical protein